MLSLKFQGLSLLTLKIRMWWSVPFCLLRGQTTSNCYYCTEKRVEIWGSYSLHAYWKKAAAEGCKQSSTQQIPCNGSVMTQLTQRAQAFPLWNGVTSLWNNPIFFKFHLTLQWARKSRWLFSWAADASVCLGWPRSHGYIVTIVNYHLVGATNYSVLSYF